MIKTLPDWRLVEIKGHSALVSKGSVGGLKREYILVGTRVMHSIHLSIQSYHLKAIQFRLMPSWHFYNVPNFYKTPYTPYTL